VVGLKQFILENGIEAVIDATHPFAARMSGNAAAACQDLARPLAILTRPAWQAVEGDRWLRVADVPAAVRALGTTPRRVFLTVGGLQLAAFAAAPWHHYIVRTIDRPDAVEALPSHRLILARGPFGTADEMNLMRDERVEVLVSKNSGGAATQGKITAARALGIEVVMIERPETGDGLRFDTPDAVVAWLDAHRATPRETA
jgi:precorrin-6A/cobalt-precorrin-6A reductase